MNSPSNDQHGAHPVVGAGTALGAEGAATNGGGGPRRVALLLLGLLAGTGLIWVGDLVTGRHLRGVVVSCADGLAVWYDSRRLPGYACDPDDMVPYTGLRSIAVSIPKCWTAEVHTFLDRDQHRFLDPEGRVGAVTISVEPIESPEAREGLMAEYKTLAARPGAIVGERVTHEEETADAAATDTTASPADTPGGAAADSRPVAPAVAAGLEQLSAYWTERIRTRGQVGATTSGRGKDGVVPDSAYSRRVWSWLLIGDRLAVRVVYAVREEWRDDQGVLDEFEMVRNIVASIKPVE